MKEGRVDVRLRPRARKLGKQWVQEEVADDVGRRQNVTTARTQTVALCSYMYIYSSSTVSICQPIEYCHCCQAQQTSYVCAHNQHKLCIISIPACGGDELVDLDIARRATLAAALTLSSCSLRHGQ